MKLELLFCGSQHGRLVWPGVLVILIVGLLVRLPLYLKPISSTVSQVLMWGFSVFLYLSFLCSYSLCVCLSLRAGPAADRSVCTWVRCLTEHGSDVDCGEK